MPSATMARNPASDAPSPSPTADSGITRSASSLPVRPPSSVADATTTRSPGSGGDCTVETVTGEFVSLYVQVKTGRQNTMLPERNAKIEASRLVGELHLGPAFDGRNIPCRTLPTNSRCRCPAQVNNSAPYVDIRGVYRGADDHRVGACLNYSSDVRHLDASVDFESAYWVARLNQVPHAANTIECRRNERLPPETGIDRHDQHLTDDRNHLFNRSNWRGRI